jgi:hypothetical protein
MARGREGGAMGVCDCRHLADAHEVVFQTIYAVKRGRCTHEGCNCQSYSRNPNYKVIV